MRTIYFSSLQSSNRSALFQGDEALEKYNAIFRQEALITSTDLESSSLYRGQDVLGSPLYLRSGNESQVLLSVFRESLSNHMHSLLLVL